jgi:hypothetical protein
MKNTTEELLIGLILIGGMLFFAILFLPLSIEYILVTGLIMAVMYVFGVMLGKRMKL